MKKNDVEDLKVNTKEVEANLRRKHEIRKELKKVAILSLDGGGIRGIIPATIMIEIERRLQELDPNRDAKIQDYFDIVAGTSTGGILSAYYLHPDYKSEKDALEIRTNHPEANIVSAKDALNLYLKNGYKIFNESKHFMYPWLTLTKGGKYKPDEIERQFDKVFKNKFFHELNGYCLITSYDLSENRSKFFSSHDYRVYLAKDVLRATSAAPTYFPPAYFSRKDKQENPKYYIDGGVIANNPVLCAYVEATSKFEQIKNSSDMLVLSIGTGANHQYEEFKKSPKKWGLLNWATKIPDITMGGGQDAVDYQIKNIFKERNSDTKNYIRIDVDEIDKKYSTDMDDASQENVISLYDAATKTAERWLMDDDKLKNQLDTFLKNVIELRNEREKIISKIDSNNRPNAAGQVQSTETLVNS